MSHTVVDSTLEQKVLEAVNDIRQCHGYRKLRALPKGIPGSSTGCVIAHALGDMDENVSVGGGTYTLNGRTYNAPVHDAWLGLVTAFDANLMPHLVQADLDEKPVLTYEDPTPMPPIKEGYKPSGASWFARTFRGAPLYIEDKQQVIDAAKQQNKEVETISKDAQKEILEAAKEQQKFDYQLQLAELETQRYLAEQRTLQEQAKAEEAEAQITLKQIELEIAREQAIRAMAEQGTQELTLQQ